MARPGRGLARARLARPGPASRPGRAPGSRRRRPGPPCRCARMPKAPGDREVDPQVPHREQRLAQPRPAPSGPAAERPAPGGRVAGRRSAGSRHRPWSGVFGSGVLMFGMSGRPMRSPPPTSSAASHQLRLDRQVVRRRPGPAARRGLGSRRGRNPGRSGRPAATSSGVAGLWHANRWRRARRRSARAVPPRRRGHQRRVVRPAARQPPGAARRERAAHRRPALLRRHALDGSQLVRLVRVDARDGAQQAHRVRDGAGRANSSSVVAVSTTNPAYITHTRWVMSATTPRSWVMSSTAVPVARGQVADEVHHLCLDGHVERGRGLVRDEQPRLERERHRDHHPLAHAAAHLVGVGPSRRSPSAMPTICSSSAARAQRRAPCPGPGARASPRSSGRRWSAPG